MPKVTAHISRRDALRCILVVLGLVFAAPAQASEGGQTDSTYNWPIKPYDVQHPVRGYFNDPRMKRESRAFHFGIDIAAPDGTPVYAVAPGKVYFDSKRAIAVVGRNGRAFGYWHIVPVVKPHQHVELHQLLGHIDRGWGHVHFAESLRRTYVDPLRPGALAPYADTTGPKIVSITVQRGRVRLPAALTSDRVDVVIEAFDMPPMSAPAPWADTPATPAALRWRLLQGSEQVVGWRTAVDFRVFHRRESFNAIYAPGTMQNRANARGTYRFYLLRAWDTSRLTDGNYEMQVEAVDRVGNRTRSSLRFTTEQRGGVNPESSEQRPSYGWPVKPFDEQHSVRGGFADPRVGARPTGGISRSLHFGIDVAAPDGTPVYSTISGTVSFNPRHTEVVQVVAGNRTFEYWHVIPAVRPGQRAVAYQTVVGHIAKGWGHVHFSERVGGVYLNPLRPGAMGPFVDREPPQLRALGFEQSGRHLAGTAIGGRVDLVAQAIDATPLPIAAPWNDMPLTPVFLRWRLVSAATGAVAVPWRTAHDVRRALGAASFESVYASRTRQNHPNRPGHYRFYLARGWHTASVTDGRYVVEAEAQDERGNAGRISVQVEIRNG